MIEHFPFESSEKEREVNEESYRLLLNNTGILK